MGGIVSRNNNPNSNSGTNSSSQNSATNSPRPNNGGKHPHASEPVKESWQIIKKIGAEVIGIAIFIKLFEKYPQTFQMFKTFREDESWKDSKAFKFHSKAFINVIGSALVNVQTEEEIGTTMNTIGAAHSLFDIRNEHFDLLKEELMKQLQLHLQDKFNKEIEKAWSEAYDHVGHAMKFAMTHGSGKM
jgi:hemoglobin-like flavoprotein